MQQTSWRPTNKNIAAAVVAAIAAPFSTIIDYMINGFGFGCWADPTATAVACAHQLPATVMLAISGVFTGLASLAAGYSMPPSESDHIEQTPPSMPAGH